MYVFSTYHVRFNGNTADNRDFARLMSDDLRQSVKVSGKNDVENDVAHNHVEDLWDWLAMLAADCPESSLAIEGYIDGSSGSGEYEDFRFEITDGSLVAYRNGWYVECSKGDFEEYEEFCDEYENADGSPVLSEEEFDAFEGEFMRIAGTVKLRVFDEIPLEGPITTREELSRFGIK